MGGVVHNQSFRVFLGGHSTCFLSKVRTAHSTLMALTRLFPWGTMCSINHLGFILGKGISGYLGWKAFYLHHHFSFLSKVGTTHSTLMVLARLFPCRRGTMCTAKGRMYVLACLGAPPLLRGRRGSHSLTHSLTHPPTHSLTHAGWMDGWIDG